MILDYSGKGATEIFQDLVTRQGVRLTDLADLYRKTGATNENEVPAFIKVENNSIVDYSDTPFAQETAEVTEEVVQETDTINLEGLSPAPSATDMMQTDPTGGTETVQTDIIQSEDQEAAKSVQDFVTSTESSFDAVNQTTIQNDIVQNCSPEGLGEVGTLMVHHIYEK